MTTIHYPDAHDAHERDWNHRKLLAHLVGQGVTDPEAYLVRLQATVLAAVEKHLPKPTRH